MRPNCAFHIPEEKKLRYIVHTDCKNEADDQFAPAHILMTDKLDVRMDLEDLYSKLQINFEA